MTAPARHYLDVGDIVHIEPRHWRLPRRPDGFAFRIQRVFAWTLDTADVGGQALDLHTGVPFGNPVRVILDQGIHVLHRPH